MLLTFSAVGDGNRGPSGPQSRSEGKRMVFDFGALPPEINSGKIYSGPGSAPLLAAATAWDALASELQTTAAAYGSTIGELTTSWQGPSSARQAEAGVGQRAWLRKPPGPARHP